MARNGESADAESKPRSRPGSLAVAQQSDPGRSRLAPRLPQRFA
ncbi:hypothetical protein GLA29479_1970 [Lysobacter antibioticus]|nr:hypothetical protein GLA29479_1970 [Lysobacter antibioticus]